MFFVSTTHVLYSQQTSPAHSCRRSHMKLGLDWPRPLRWSWPVRRQQPFRKSPECNSPWSSRSVCRPGMGRHSRITPLRRKGRRTHQGCVLPGDLAVYPRISSVPQAHVQQILWLVEYEPHPWIQYPRCHLRLYRQRKEGRVRKNVVPETRRRLKKSLAHARIEWALPVKANTIRLWPLADLGLATAGCSRLLEMSRIRSFDVWTTYEDLETSCMRRAVVVYATSEIAASSSDRRYWRTRSLFALSEQEVRAEHATTWYARGTWPFSGRSGGTSRTMHVFPPCAKVSTAI